MMHAPWVILMTPEMLIACGIFLLSVFMSSVSQVLLKKATLKTYSSALREYLNPWVVCAYSIFVVSTLLTLMAYRVVPLSLGPLLEATSYLYVTAFGVVIFHELLTAKKIAALILIVLGIIVYSTGV